MRITVNFRNPGDGTITLWNLVSFSYIVVSRLFSGTYSDIWATIASVPNPVNNIAAPASVDTVGTYYLNAAGALCSIYQDPNYISSNSAACKAAAVVAGTVTGGTTVIHAYIMGFQFNPAKTSAHYLFAAVLPQTGAVSVPTD